jgi:hypothetical protein
MVVHPLCAGPTPAHVRMGCVNGAARKGQAMAVHPCMQTHTRPTKGGAEL